MPKQTDHIPDAGTAPTVSIRKLAATDADAILDIYQQGIDTGHATFQQSAPSWTEWDATHLATPRLGAFVDGELAGWAALSATSSRCVYAGVAEESVYVANKYGGRGIGRQLLEGLISASEEAGFWTLTAGIFPENNASIAVHKKAGFQILGRRERIGKMSHGPMAGQWRDVILLERRSAAKQFD
ncbi:N-acetyltransferase family protein [Parasphingorhabdus sp.]|uniref:GNAT family N-acetyltransferase n=1 Tax=Parasphingorhabdus sp. TaxID=2709688 RepID=UPI003266BD83